MNNILILLTLLALFFFLLVKSTGWLMEALHSMARSTHASTFGLATFLLALSTSLPELIVSISAGLRGASTLALGNVVGSNIANITLVLGGAAMIAYGLRASDQFVKTEVFYVFMAGSLPLLLLVDGSLTRVDGGLLLIVYMVYVVGALKKKSMRERAEVLAYVPLWRRTLVTLHKPRVERGLIHLIGASVLLVLAADMIVRLALILAKMWQIPELVVGLFIIGLGTSLPELVTEIKAVRHREVSMAYGNILGSVVANSTLILGIALVLSPINKVSMWPYSLAVSTFILVYGLFWYFVWTKHRLDRWEGGMLVGAYVVFMLLELLRA